MRKKVLMLCTGGTIGMLPNENGALAPASWQSIKRFCPAVTQLPFDVDTQEMALIDSSDMHPGYWVGLAGKIRDEYANYDGFVILHGTDTMTYTATALSFMLENLDKPVIVTGSQLPLAQPRSDGAQNLVTALKIAASDGIDTVPEVCVLFHNKLLRGNRARKVSATGLSGFDSPNYGVLAEIGEPIKVNANLIRKPSKEGLVVHGSLNPNVMLLDIFPGISAAALRSVFDIQGLRGVVLRTYGSGNAPASGEFLNEIDYAVNRKGLVVVNITQCNQGAVETGLYEAGSHLPRLGVISGSDMTPEAALVKMMFLLGQGYDAAAVKERMQKDLRGEQSALTD
ncbi:MAG: asparaginase [Oscillospiraceae bacterium]|jgi:L-asparaginase|nr:asparaginase [Oscillospiraceae bacterium]